MAGGARWPPDEVVPSSDPVGDEAWGIGESGDTSAAWLRGRAGAAPPALQPSPIPDSLPASERIRLEARRRAAAAADDDVLDDDPPHVHQALLSDDSDDALASPFASPALCAAAHATDGVATAYAGGALCRVASAAPAPCGCAAKPPVHVQAEPEAPDERRSAPRALRDAGAHRQSSAIAREERCRHV